MKSTFRSHGFWRASSILILTYTLLISTAFGQAVAPQATQTLSVAERKVSAAVSVKTLREVTTALADKSMEGRGTGQPGGAKAARYLALKFATLGLKPLGDVGTYQQYIGFRSTQLAPETSLKVGDVSFKLGDEFVPAPPYTQDKATASGRVVFVGYGVTSDKLKRDDLAGLDVKDKIVLVIGGRPKDVDETIWQQEASQQAIALNLIRRGVAGLIVANAGSKRASFSLLADYLSRRSVTLADASQMPFRLPPIVLISDAAAEKAFNGTGMTYAETLAKAETAISVSRDLQKSGTIDVMINREDVIGSNVVGYIEGTDAKLKDQAIVYTAHYDAYGIDSKGRIYPGAADNALGVGELVAIAEAFAKSKTKPRRSIIFLAVTGEEYGLLGAEDWVNKPTWPIDKVVANLNFDGIGTEIYGPVKRIVGFGAEYSDLGKTMEGVFAATGMILTEDPLPEEGVFYRSDHYAFVKKGVPALMLLGGPDGETSKWVKRAQAWMETDYHQPGDIVRPEWVWDGARTVSVIGTLIGMRVANAEASPQWLPSSPFKRAGVEGEPPSQKD